MKKIYLLIFITALLINRNGYAGLTERPIDRNIFGIQFGMGIEEIRKNCTVIDYPYRLGKLEYYGVLSEQLYAKNVFLIKCGLLDGKVIFINVVYRPAYSSTIGWENFKKQFVDKFGPNSPKEILEYTENYYNWDVSVVHDEFFIKEVLGWSDGLTTLYIVNAYNKTENVDFFMCTYLDALMAQK